MGLRWILVLVCLALGAGAAAVSTWQSPLEYTSTARVFVAPESKNSDRGAVYDANVRVDSVVELAASEAVAALVTRRVGGGTAAIAEAVEVDWIEDTTLIDISVTDDSAQRALDVAAAYSEVVVEKLIATGHSQGSFVARLTDEAQLPVEAEPRPWWRNLGIGAGSGLLLGLVLAIALGIRSARPRPVAG